jgi:hypothetical protein
MSPDNDVFQTCNYTFLTTPSVFRLGTNDQKRGCINRSNSMAKTATFWPFLGWMLLLQLSSLSWAPAEAAAHTTAFAFCSGHFLPSQRGRCTGSTATTTTCLGAKKAKATKKKASPKAKAAKAASSSVGFGRALGKWDGCEPLRAWLRERGAEVDGLNVGVPLVHFDCS